MYIRKTEDYCYYYKDKQKTIIHRKDGPAIEYSNGNKCWYLNGKLHRDDGPAIEFNFEWVQKTQYYYWFHSTNDPVVERNRRKRKEWWLNGKRHREDGPAIEFYNGDKEWYLNGKLHREDGPAIDHIDGYKYWYLKGKPHREDGPAIEFSGGVTVYYLNGKYYSKTKFEQVINKFKHK